MPAQSRTSVFTPPPGWGTELGSPQNGRRAYVVIDCETCDGTEEATRAYRAWAWKPNYTWKPETVEEKRREDMEKWLGEKEDWDGQIVSRRALIYPAPLIVITVKCEKAFHCLHVLPLERPSKWLKKLATAYGVQLQACKTRKKMLQDLAVILTAYGPQIVFAGHNVSDFDLPRIVDAMNVHEVPKPVVLSQTHLPVYDTMREFQKLHRSDGFVSLPRVCRYHGIDLALKGDGRGEITGKDIPRLYEEKKYEKILMYAIFDVLDEEALYERMTQAAC